MNLQTIEGVILMLLWTDFISILVLSMTRVAAQKTPRPLAVRHPRVTGIYYSSGRYQRL